MKTRKQTTRRPLTRYARIAAGVEQAHPDKPASGKDAATPTMEHAISLGYSKEGLKSVPEEALMSLGCGNPLAHAALRPGEVVLDLGCGGGLDAFLAAQLIHPTGRVIGVDATLKMVRRAKAHARKMKLENVEFKHAPIEHLPLEDSSVDVAISNCVMNHCADKVQAFKEVYRVLKLGGRMYIADLVTAGTFSEAALDDKIWGEWLRVAQSKNEYLAAIKQAGFKDAAVETQRTFPMAEKDERLKGRILSIVVAASKRQDGRWSFR